MCMRKQALQQLNRCNLQCDAKVDVWLRKIMPLHKRLIILMTLIEGTIFVLEVSSRAFCQNIYFSGPRKKGQ